MVEDGRGLEEGLRRSPVLQDELQEFAHKYRDFITHAPTPIFEIDFRTRRFVSVNDAMCQMLGYTRDELLSMDSADILVDESRERFQERVGQWMTRQPPDQNVEYRVGAQDGREFCVLLHISHTTDPGGRPAGALVIAQDITEHKRLEDELRRERELLQAIYDTIPIMLTIYDPNIREIAINKHFERVTGWTRQDTDATHIMDLVYPDAEYRAWVAEYMQSLEPGFRDLLMAAKDGTTIESSWANVALRDGRQVGIGLDVSELKREERRRARYTAVLEGINRILEQVVTAETDQAVADTCLAAALQVTGSKLGFVANAGPDGQLRDVAMGDVVSEASGAGRPPAEPAFHGMCGYVPGLRRGFYRNEPPADAESLGLPADHPPITCFLGVPLIRGEQPLGLLVVANREGGYGPEQLEDLEALAPAVVQALEKKLAEEALLRRTHELEVLNRTNQRLAGSLETEDILDVALEELCSLFGAAGAAAWLVEAALDGDRGPDTRPDDLVCRRLRGPGPALTLDLRQRAGDGLAGWVFGHGCSLAVPDVAAELPVPGPLYPALLTAHLGIDVRAVLSVPLRLKSTVAGVLQVLDARSRGFDARDQSLAESITAAAGSAIDRAHLYEQARRNAVVRDTLLREVNHRVKNNLSAILGLVHAEGRRTREGDKLHPQEMLDDLAARVGSLATVHAILSASGWRPLEVGELAREVFAAAALSSDSDDRRMALDVNAAPIQVDPEQAHQLALVLGELTTNALKYGRGDQGLQVALHVSLEDGQVCLVYRDGGPGYPPAVLAGHDRSVGLWLIDSIVRTSLRGHWSMSNDGGAVTRVWFPGNPGLRGGMGIEWRD